MFKWIRENKKWVFNGIGATLIAVIASWLWSSCSSTPITPTLSPISTIVQVTPDDFYLRVIVTDKDTGAAISNASVRFNTGRQEKIPEDYTNSDGSAIIPIPGIYDGEKAFLVVDVDGYKIENREVDLTKQQPLPIRVALNPILTPTPTQTPLPAPTDTPTHTPTNTPIPPTDTPIPPTDTLVPSTDTPTPLPTTSPAAEEVTYPFANGPDLFHPKPNVTYTKGDTVPFEWEEYSLKNDQFYSIRVTLKDELEANACIHKQTQVPKIDLELDCPKGIYKWSVAIATELSEDNKQECPESRYNEGWCSDSKDNQVREFGLGVKHPSEGISDERRSGEGVSGGTSGGTGGIP